MEINLLGTRGSIPVNGSRFVEYGGASTCIFVRMGGHPIILDAGTGLLDVSEFLHDDDKEALMFISHAHADHIMGIGMCPVSFNPNFTFKVYGCPVNGMGIKAQLESFYHNPTWPVGPDGLPATFEFTDLEYGKQYSLGDVQVKIMSGVHPGGVTLFRLECNGESLVYATDCSITKGLKPALLDFCKGCDAIFLDGQYSDKEAETMANFGHNSWNLAASFGLEVGAKKTYIIHHHFHRTDPELRIAEAQAKAINPNIIFGKQENIGLSDQEKMKKFIDSCLALTSEHDRENLLSHILDTAMEISYCDAGTLYLLEDDGLHFYRMVTKSMGIKQGGHDDPINLPPVPLDPSYASAWAVINKKTVNIPDIHDDTGFDFKGSYKYDEMTGYRTQSMLMVPMENEKGEIIGLMQLINAKDAGGMTIPFDASVEQLIVAIASQAAISITNLQYANQITELLDSLVGALSTAIDERSPYNANHTKSMVKYASNFLDWLDKTDSPNKFDENKRRTFLMSVWLHDVGKLVVPLEVMDKPDRLGSDLEKIKTRLREKTLLGKIDYLEHKITQAEYNELIENCASIEDFVVKTNTAGFMTDEALAFIESLKTSGWITDKEYTELSIRKGTLTAEERATMESHVSVTKKILSNVAFPKIYSKVPEWASAHHELLNGKGYPEHLTEENIPKEVRLLTILDVFDALTAEDRPYKPAMPVDKALSILHIMAEKEGSLDIDVLKAFEESKAWEK